MSLVPFCFGYFLPAMGDPIDPTQQDSEERNEVGNAREHLIGVERQGALRKVGTETEIVEADRRKENDRRAADFGLAEYVRQIVARIVVDPLLGLLQQFVAVAELGG